MAKLEKQCLPIVIRTRDLERLLPTVMQRLAHQTVQPSEVIVVDNFGSKKALKKMTNYLSSTKREVFHSQLQMKLVPLSDDEFTHPYSTNLGVSIANGDLVCIINGHSLPSTTNWLETGIAHFGNSKAAGVSGYFTAHEDGTVWEKIGYDWLWKNRNEVSRAYAKDDCFSTINCIIRKALWKEYPFDEKLPLKVPNARRYGGEDYDWGMEMKARGYEIIIDPKFNISHSHRESLTKLLFKNMICRQIRKSIRSFERPRQSYTKLGNKKPLYYDI